MTRTVFDEDTKMLRPWSVAHFKDDVLQAGSLSGGPMYSSNGRGRRHISHVDDEVSNLPIEGVGGTECVTKVPIDDTGSTCVVGNRF